MNLLLVRPNGHDVAIYKNCKSLKQAKENGLRVDNYTWRKFKNFDDAKKWALDYSGGNEPTITIL